MKGHEFDVLSCPLDGWTLVEASAGTGKTWNIGGLYLRFLLEKRLEVKDILVVTFTRAATDELRDRIRNRIAAALAYLEGRGISTGDEFASALLERLFAEGRTREDMAGILRLAFCSFDQAAIFTIHSFCQRALALSAFSSGQAFAVKAETDDSELVQEAVNDFWRRHVAGGRFSPAFSGWLEQKRFTPDRLATQLRQHLKKPLATVKWPDTADTAQAETVQETIGRLETVFAEASACWTAEKETVMTLLKEKCADGTLNKTSYRIPYIDSAAAAFDRLFATGDALAMIGEKDKTGHMTASKLAKSTRKNREMPQHPFFRLAEMLAETCREVETELEAARYGLLKRFLAEAGDLLKEKKRERRTIAFDDMLGNLYEALHDPDMPWLAEAVRKHFPAALIDEFQDTDPLQYAIFSAIYGESDKPVFLVGDPKQAIYSFRNADLHTYLAARKRLDARFTLMENHRSVPGLIDACNTLFSVNERAFMQDGLDFVPVRSGNRALPHLRDESGNAGKETESMRIWMLPETENEPPARSDALRQSVEAVADEIARLIQAGRNGTCTLDGRPVGAGDMAVLVRSHNEAALIREALANRGIGSVSFSQDSVFHSREAQELECVLHAMMTPEDEPLLMAAVSTEMMGLDSVAVEALADDEAGLSGLLERFGQYRRAWLGHGAGYALRWLFDREKVVARLLALPDGERRVTNLRHLAELVSREDESKSAPDSLMRWYTLQRENDHRAEEAELRLETDRNLVQVMTMHRSKGLEFPFVFCPLLWDNQPKNAGRGGDGIEYHDGDETVIDYRPLSETDGQIVKKRMNTEQAAEMMRLIYVALTRAIHRCYLVAGCYTFRNNATQSRKSLLNWLVAGNGFSPEDWLSGNNGKKAETVLLPETGEIGDAWKALEARSPHIRVIGLPSPVYRTVGENDKETEILSARTFAKTLDIRWRMNSFSGLIRNAVDETETGDHDERIATGETPVSGGELPAFLKEDDILLFPKGTYAGSCLHAVFEHADFTDRTTWEAAARTALSRYPQEVDGRFPFRPETAGDACQSMALDMLENVMATPLPGGIMLNTVENGRKLVEWPFCLSSAPLSAGEMNRLAKRFGYAVPQLVFDDMTAYLNGFVDLVFEADGRFWLLDWKSNHLGYRQEDYCTARIDQAMTEHGYHWQYLLYTVALHRYLASRMPKYDYDRHFGGVFYLFVRGVRPAWRQADGSPSGVFFHKPGRHVIEAADRLFGQQVRAQKEKKA